MMAVKIEIKGDAFKLAQMLSKFSSQHRTNFTLTRQENEGFILDISTSDFGELIRRLRHIKGCDFKIQELRAEEERVTADSARVNLTKTNIDALMGKSTVAKTRIDPVDGGQIKLLGELWSCHPKHGKAIREGSTVRVVGVEGVNLMVEEVK